MYVCVCVSACVRVCRRYVVRGTVCVRMRACPLVFAYVDVRVRERVFTVLGLLLRMRMGARVWVRSSEAVSGQWRQKWGKNVEQAHVIWTEIHHNGEEKSTDGPKHAHTLNPSSLNMLMPFSCRFSRRRTLIFSLG